MRIDDSLDVLAVHGIGGATGTLLAAVFAAEAFGGAGLGEATMGSQFYVQTVGVVATAIFSAVVTLIICYLSLIHI